MEWFRLITLHPAVVHFTIGALPLILLGYLIAQWRRSPSWAAAADAALWITAVATLAALATGLVSFLLIDWPGGLFFWRWLHLGLGAATGTLLVVFALHRWRVRRRREHGGRGEVVAAAAITLVALATGWVGGDVLVFHAGAGVKAAGDGVLAPPTWQLSADEPEDLHQAMGRLRAHWAAITVGVAKMNAEAPSDAGLEAIAREAGEVRAIAEWMSALDTAEASLASIEGGGTGGRSDGSFLTFEQQVAAMGSLLRDRADAVLEAARERELGDVAAELGKLTTQCVRCHDQLRWQD